MFIFDQSRNNSQLKYGAELLWKVSLKILNLAIILKTFTNARLWYKLALTTKHALSEHQRLWRYCTRAHARKSSHLLQNYSRNSNCNTVTFLAASIEIWRVYPREHNNWLF